MSLLLSAYMCCSINQATLCYCKKLRQGFVISNSISHDDRKVFFACISGPAGKPDAQGGGFRRRA